MAIFYTNISSLRSNFDYLNLYLQTSDLEYDIVALSEVWIKESEKHLYKIPGYSCAFQERSNMRSGGVMIFIKENLTFSVTGHEYPCQECLVLNIDLSGFNLKLLFIYRYGPSNLNNFLQELDELLETHNINCILGDINLDILTNTHTPNKTKYLNYLSSKGFISLINDPTRVTGNTDSCIDHLFVKLRIFDLLSAKIITPGLSDHYPISIELKKTKTIPNIFKTIKSLNYNILKTEVKNTNWQELYDIDSPDQAFTSFILKFQNLIHKAQKTIKVNSQNKKRQPWINQDLIIKCNRKNKLYKILKKYPLNETIRNEFQTLNQELKHKIKEAKTKYYTNEFKDKTDSRSFWKIINSVARKKTKDCISEIKDVASENIIIKVAGNEKLIANMFNNHFSTAAEKLLEKNNTKVHIENYTPTDSTDKLNWTPLTLDEIDKAIKKVKDSMASTTV